MLFASSHLLSQALCHFKVSSVGAPPHLALKRETWRSIRSRSSQLRSATCTHC